MDPVRTYKALLFDLCNTLVVFESRRYPVLWLDGEAIMTTAGLLHRVLAKHHPVDLEDFARTFLDVSQRLGERKEADHREISTARRMAETLEALGIAPQPDLVETLVETHMAAVTGALVFNPAHRPLLERLSQAYALGVVSNFDHTPSALGVLEREALGTYFRTVVISEAVGWRKPHPRIFREALDALGVAPQDALFIGDSPEADVAGAAGVGMDTAWLNPQGQPLPLDLPAPTYLLEDLGDLAALLGWNRP